MKKYSLRLLLGAIISHIPHALAFGFSIWEFWRATSVMWSLFLGLIALAVYMKKDLPVILRILIIGCCCVLSYPGNWNCIAVLWVLGFGVFRESNGKKWAAFIGVTVLYILEFFVIESDGGFYFWSRFFVLVVIPLLSMYRGELGRKSKVLQWSYYLIYPVHFVALYMIQLLIG